MEYEIEITDAMTVEGGENETIIYFKNGKPYKARLVKLGKQRQEFFLNLALHRCENKFEDIVLDFGEMVVPVIPFIIEPNGEIHDAIEIRIVQ